MGDLENCCCDISILQGMLYLRTSIGNYDTILILRVVAPPSRPYVETQRVI